MLVPYEIPLTPNAQKFAVDLPGGTYSMSLAWNVPASCWVLDIADAFGAALVGGVPLVAGADLLAPYGYLGLGGGLLAMTDGDGEAPPTYENLGVTGRLYFVAELPDG